MKLSPEEQQVLETAAALCQRRRAHLSDARQAPSAGEFDQVLVDDQLRAAIADADAVLDQLLRPPAELTPEPRDSELRAWLSVLGLD